MNAPAGGRSTPSAGHNSPLGLAITSAATPELKCRATSTARIESGTPASGGAWSSGGAWPIGDWQAVTVKNEEVGEAATELLDMRARRRVVPDLPPRLRPGTLADAYAIQEGLVAALVAQSAGRCIGFKVACTSEIAQAALQIDRPVFGRLMSQSTSPSGTTLATDEFTHRVIEAEFAFRIGVDVEPVDAGHTPATIAEHIDALIPSIEIVDYRFESWAVGALRIAADNAIHGWWIRGDPVTDWRGHDLAAATVSVSCGGEVVTTGSGSAVLGHPLNVMAWLADELPRFGLRLRQGDVVTTGVATDVFEAAAGESCVADFGPFGTVTVTFE
jgi:2-keto-4-pentenoate hydratase